MFRFQLARLNMVAALCLCGMPGPVCAQDGHDAPVFKTSRETAPKVRKEYCGDRPFYSVKVMKNADGEIGGYVLQPAIRDAPVPFLDHQGNALATFHIFGSDEEKRKAMTIVGPLTKRFPVQEALNCSAGAARG